MNQRKRRKMCPDGVKIGVYLLKTPSPCRSKAFSAGMTAERSAA